jgi:uncharacterized membrane protein YbhN (UPF0104 family)
MEVDPSVHGKAPSDGARVGRWAFAPLVAGLIILAAVVTVALHFSDIDAFAMLAQSARPEWLLAAVTAQVLTYACSTGVWRIALERTGYSPPLRELIPLGVGKLFVDQVIPAAGVGGAALVMRALTRRGVPPPAVVAALLVGLATYYAAYLLFTLGAVATMWLRRELHPAAIAAVTAFGAFAVGSPTLLLYLAHRRKGQPPKWARRLPAAAAIADAIGSADLRILKSPRLVAEALALQLGIFSLDALTLWIMFQALGSPVRLTSAYVAFAMGSVAGTIGLVPLGLGAFEAATIGTLRLEGVPLESALAATLLLRGFTMWLPMAPGLWIARREIEGETG